MDWNVAMNRLYLALPPAAVAVILTGCAPESSSGGPTSLRVAARNLELPPGGPCIPEISQFPGQAISTLPCSAVKVRAPFATDFSAGASGMLDRAGNGIDFTMFLPSNNGGAYHPENITLDTAGATLELSTTSGINQSQLDAQDNSLGVGLDLPNANFRIEVTIEDPDPGSGSYEQAGLWLGISDGDYVKLVVQSAPGGTVVQALLEEADSLATSVNQGITLPVGALGLALEALPARRQLRAYARAGENAPEALVASFSSIPDAWFNTDGAGIDFNVGTRSFAGIFATHRNRPSASGPVTYRFSNFGITAFEDREEPSIGEIPTPTEPIGPVDFERFSASVNDPSALAFAPDGRLYVGTVTGTLHALRFDYENKALVEDRVIETLANRLLLGLTVDPASTADNVILWAGHSDVSQGSGEANSGMVSRLSGPDLAQREDVVIGLPRAIANHSTNNLRFGPDGRLYISQGGNTGAGAANDGASEFGPRPEQPLCAALLVADVKAPGFDGDCRPDVDLDGARMDSSGIAPHDVPCDVGVFASGLRNSFDAVFHSNGSVYATDNALGVEGTFPDLAPTPLAWDRSGSCEGPVRGAALNSHNPGVRNDLLLRLDEGGYYGHPNPSRGECVFYAGNPTAAADTVIPQTGGGTTTLDVTGYPVGLLPDPRYRPAMYSFGEHRSANGMIEYRSDAFCGALEGDLLVTYYANTDQIRRLTLSADGTRVVSEGTLPRSTTAAGGATLVDPLPITQDPLGRIYVGEFGGDRVTVFEPIPIECEPATEGVSR
jgi:hypothetical protein